MKTVNHECYVSFEVAKLLKEAGFDWKVTGWYEILRNGTVIDSENFEPYSSNWNNSEYSKTTVSMPTLDVAQRWLREMKHIEAVPWRWPTKVGFVDGYKPWSYKIVIYKNLEEVDIDDFNASGEDYFKSYEQAQEAGIKEALEMILENK